MVFKTKRLKFLQMKSSNCPDFLGICVMAVRYLCDYVNELECLR